MTWTNLSFPFASKLTSTQMTQLFDNLTALANGDSGAPNVTQAGLGAAAVGQGELKTTTAAGSVVVAEIGAEEAASATYTLTGGTYSWWQASANSSGGGGDIAVASFGSEADRAAGIIGFGGIDVNGGLIAVNPAFTIFVDERYVQASPPYTDGPCFVFIAVNLAGEIRHISVGPDPPWAYHGPTIIVPQRVDGKTGKLFRSEILIDGILLKRALGDPAVLERYLSGAATIAVKEVEITMSYKDSDKNTMPHPFIGNDLTGLTIFMLEPGTSLMVRFEEMCQQEVAKEVRKLISAQKLNLNLQSPVAYPGTPVGVSVCKATMKLTV